MGSFSLWIIVLVVIGIPALVIGVVIWLIARRSRRATNTAHSISSPTSQPAAARLQELATLKSAGLITDTEFERKRAEVLENV